MNLELEIERVFGGKAFVRPLFYSYPGGLRFALSETGGVIEQFLSALQKSTKICSDVFVGERRLSLVCAFTPEAINLLIVPRFKLFDLPALTYPLNGQSGARK